MPKQWPPCVVTLCERFLNEAEGDEDRAVIAMAVFFKQQSGRAPDPFLVASIQKAIADVARAQR
jgi:hypothetical protein